MPDIKLDPKPPRDDPSRRAHQSAVKRSIIILPAFGLTLLAAELRHDPGAGYANYALPTAPEELAFTLKGALRLEMMRSQQEAFRKYRRLFGSNTRQRTFSLAQPGHDGRLSNRERGSSSGAYHLLGGKVLGRRRIPGTRGAVARPGRTPVGQRRVSR